jgi:hypothetical protein
MMWIEVVFEIRFWITTLMMLVAVGFIAGYPRFRGKRLLLAFGVLSVMTPVGFHVLKQLRRVLELTPEGYNGFVAGLSALGAASAACFLGYVVTLKRTLTYEGADPRAKRLADPLRIFSNVFLGFGAVQGVAALVFLELAAGDGLVADAGTATQWRVSALYGAAGMLTALALGVVTRPRRRVNAFYLRAFATDDDTAKIRRRLALLLGKDFRLSGIRSPQKRSSVFARFFFGTWAALRYAGSRFMDLEAGNDWLARLMASFAEARIAFLDVRRLTPGVESEVALAWKQLGPRRCLFVVDPSRTPEQWKESIAALTQSNPEHGLVQVAVLNPTDPDAFIVTVREFLQQLPTEPAGHSEEAAACVRKALDPKDWNKGWTTGQVSQAFIGMIAAVAFLVLWELSRGNDDVFPLIAAIALPYAILVWGMYFVVLCRRIASRAFGAAFLSFLLLLGSLSALAGVFFLTVQPIRERARTIAAEHMVRQLAMAFRQMDAAQSTENRSPDDLTVESLYRDHLVPDAPRNDPWGEPYFLRQSEPDRAVIGSNGPDRRQETSDDIVQVVELSPPR